MPLAKTIIASGPVGVDAICAILLQDIQRHPSENINTFGAMRFLKFSGLRVERIDVLSKLLFYELMGLEPRVVCIGLENFFGAGSSMACRVHGMTWTSWHPGWHTGHLTPQST